MAKLPKQQKPHDRTYLAFLLPFSLLALLIIGFFLKQYVDKQQAVSELAIVSKNLRVVYDKILVASDGNVESSYFRDSCSESSVEFGRGTVRCGPSAAIKLKYGINADKSKDVINNAVQGNNFSADIGRMMTSSTTGEVYIEFIYSAKDVNCLVSHAEEKSYYMMCRKTVPDFLPGYVIEK